MQGTALVTRLRTRTVIGELPLLPCVITALDHLKVRIPLIDDVVHLAAQVVILHLASNLVDLRLAHCSIQPRHHLCCVLLVPRTALCCFSSRGPLVALPAFRCSDPGFLVVSFCSH